MTSQTTENSLQSSTSTNQIRIPVNMVEKPYDKGITKKPQKKVKEETVKQTNPWTREVQTETHFIGNDDSEVEEPQDEYEIISNENGIQKIQLLIELINIKLGGSESGAEDEIEEVITPELRNKLENRKSIDNYIVE